MVDLVERLRRFVGIWQFHSDERGLASAAMSEAATLIETQAARIAELEGELVAARRLATDRRYFMDAYHSMLGENGLKVAAMWVAENVKRVHHSWGPEAHKLTGEERAAVILEMENAPRTLITDIDGHLDAARALNGGE